MSVTASLRSGAASCSVARRAEPAARVSAVGASSSRRALPAGAGALLAAPPSRPPALALARRPRGAVHVCAQAASAEEGSVKWPQIYRALNDLKLQSIPPSTASEMAAEGGAVLVDVRVVEDFEKCHAAGAISVPLFRRVNLLDTDVKGVFRFFVYGLNGVAAVEPNPKFEADLAAAVADKAAIFYCEAGGTVEPTPNFLYGRESRSLRAAYKASVDGRVKRIFHLDGGLYQWNKDGFETVGQYDTSNLYRTPNAANKATVLDSK